MQFGGIIFFRNNGYDERVIIRPSKLRAALVKEELIAHHGTKQLDILKPFAHLYDFVDVILDAIVIGAQIPDEILLAYLVEVGLEVDLWKKYYSIFPDRIISGIKKYPDTIGQCMGPGLAYQPEFILPLMLDRAAEDHRQLNQFPDHPLRIIQDWLSRDYQTEKTIERRQKLLASAVKYLKEGGDQKTTISVAAYILLPNFDDSNVPPGSGSQVTFVHGLFTINVLQKIFEFWPMVFQLIKEVEKKHYSLLFEVMNYWVHPGYSVNSVDDEVYDYMRDCAKKMFLNMVDICKEHPSLTQHIKEELKLLGESPEIDVDEIYEAIYPEKNFDIDIYNQDKYIVPIQVLAEKWKDDDCKKDVIRTIKWAEAEASLVGNHWPCLVPLLCQELAKRVIDPIDWGRFFSDEDMLPNYVYPFLEIAVQNNNQGWQEFAKELIEHKEYIYTVCGAIFQLDDPPENLVIQILNELGGGHTQFIQFDLCKKLSTDIVKRLLSHPNSNVAFSAAIGEWLRNPKGSVRDDLFGDWKQAILEFGEEDHYLRDIFAKYPELSNDWLIKKIETNSQDSRERWVNQARFAIDPLNIKDRKKLLQIIKENDRGFIGNGNLIRWIVSDDLGLYQYVFEIYDDTALDILVLPLTTLPDGGDWAKKALLAYEHGIPIESICSASFSRGLWEVQIGTQSLKHRELRDAFEKLLDHSDTRISQIASYGYKLANDRLNRALEQERELEIYGYDEIRN